MIAVIVAAVIASVLAVAALARWIAAGHRTYTAITRGTTDLRTCRNILAATEQPNRKEKQQP